MINSKSNKHQTVHSNGCTHCVATAGEVLKVLREPDEENIMDGFPCPMCNTPMKPSNETLFDWECDTHGWWTEKEVNK